MAAVVQDDADAQPYRLQYEDGTLSQIFYRAEQVELAADLQKARAASNEQLQEASAKSGAKKSSRSAQGGRTAGGARRGAATSEGRAGNRETVTAADAEFSPFGWLQDAVRRRVEAVRAPRSLSMSVFADLARSEVASSPSQKEAPAGG